MSSIIEKKKYREREMTENTSHHLCLFHSLNKARWPSARSYSLVVSLTNESKNEKSRRCHFSSSSFFLALVVVAVVVVVIIAITALVSIR
jgi:hypothetical protein